MAWLKKSITCPHCNKISRPKKSKNGQIVCSNCKQTFQKKSSWLALKEIMKPKHNTIAKKDEIIPIKQKKPRHRKIKSLRNDMRITIKSLNYKRGRVKRANSLSPNAKEPRAIRVKNRKNKRKRKHSSSPKTSPALSGNSTMNISNGIYELVHGYIKTGYDIGSDPDINSNIENLCIHEFLDIKHSVNSPEHAVDVIHEIFDNDLIQHTKYTFTAQKYELLQQLKNSIHNNDNPDDICMCLLRWLDGNAMSYDEIKCRELVLKILIPYCKIKALKIKRSSANQFAEKLIKTDWSSSVNTNTIYHRDLTTQVLLSIYYATDSRLIEWKHYLVPLMKARLVQVWQFLSGVCVFAANHKYTTQKQKALNDIKIYLSDDYIVRLIRGTFMQQYTMRNVRDYKIIIACSEFVFGIKHILDKMKAVNSLYNQVKDSKIMRDVVESPYAEILLMGDNAFDFSKTISEIKPRCCDKYTNLDELSEEVDKTRDHIDDLRDIIDELRTDHKEYDEDLTELRADTMITNKKTKLLDDDIRDIAAEILELKQEIFKREQMNHRLFEMDKLDFANWDKWSVEEILHWILSLDDDKFMKYKNKLYDKLWNEKIRGNELYLINESDLIYFGISDVNDRRQLLNHVQLLTNNEYANSLSEMSPPMAFNDYATRQNQNTVKRFFV